jgi:VWFA-related protein
MRHRLPCLLVLGVAFPLRAQAPARRLPAPQPGDPLIRVSVNLVQTDVAVADSHGRPVRDLEPRDFQIFEDGKLQTITNFSWIDVSPNKPAPSKGAAPALPQALHKEDVRRSIVLMVDDTGPHGWETALAARDAARKFVASQIAPDDLVAITASHGGMGFYSRFTNDKEQLYAAIDHLAQRTGFGQWYADPPTIMVNGVPVQIRLAPGEPAYGARDNRNPPNPIGYLAWAIQGLQYVPGRKAVVLFSAAFAAPRSLIDLANRAGVVIYVIDPTGVPDPFCGRCAFVIPSNAPWRLLAQETGGLWMRSTPGALEEDLRKILDDMSGYYLIGYHPVRSNFELSQGRPTHHAIQVKVLRAGLTVRARNGFLGVPDAGARPAARTSPEILRNALESPFNTGGIRLRIDPFYAASAPDPKTKLRQPFLRVMLQIDGRDLKFSDAEDGRKKAKYGILMAVFNQDGTPVNTVERSLAILVKPDEAARLAANGLHGATDVKLPGPGEYQARAAMIDEASNAVGSAYAFLTVPDFNKPGIVLSSIELSAAQSSSNAKNTGWAEFAIGTSVHFECDVLGLKTTPRPQVEMEIRLFREGKEMPALDSHVLSVPPTTLAENFLAGNLQIKSDLEPGDYAMQLLAWDRNAPVKKQAAVQWTKLTIVKP